MTILEFFFETSVSMPFEWNHEHHDPIVSPPYKKRLESDKSLQILGACLFY